jgi:TM2 domain-containing membrane protein YozV
MKSKSTAGVLALFLGGIGAHKFYLGQTGLGIVYLLFFWTFIPAFVAFFEAISLFTMNDNIFNLKFNGYAPTSGAPHQVAQAVTINMPGHHLPNGGGGGPGVADELLKLSELRTSGVLTDDEFASRKQRLLG